MADQAEETETVENEDSNAIREARAAASRSAQGKKDAEARAEAAESELATLRHGARVSSVKTVLRNMGAPEGLAEFYPSDAEISDEAVRSFVTDKVGINPETQAAWARYEANASGGQPPGSGPDPLDELRDKALAETASVYAKNTVVTDAEMQSYRDLRKEVEKLDREYGAEVSAGRKQPLVDPTRGFGGLYDPPNYAVRAKSGKGAQE